MMNGWKNRSTYLFASHNENTWRRDRRLVHDEIADFIESRYEFSSLTTEEQRNDIAEHLEKFLIDDIRANIEACQEELTVAKNDLPTFVVGLYSLENLSLFEDIDVQHIAEVWTREIMEELAHEKIVPSSTTLI